MDLGARSAVLSAPPTTVKMLTERAVDIAKRIQDAVAETNFTAQRLAESFPVEAEPDRTSDRVIDGEIPELAAVFQRISAQLSRLEENLARLACI